jgi:hypothetical protein
VLVLRRWRSLRLVLGQCRTVYGMPYETRLVKLVFFVFGR